MLLSAHLLPFLPTANSGITNYGASSPQMTPSQSPVSSCQRPWMVPWMLRCPVWMIPPTPGSREAWPREDPLSPVVSEDSRTPSSFPTMMILVAWFT